MEYSKVTDDFAVAPQITVQDIAIIKTLGYTAIINNRPDQESPGQPASAELKASAEENGLSYHEIPILSGSMPPEAIITTRDLLAEIDGPAFAFCRSGTRSITLWALSQIGERDGNEILSAVAAAGYDLPFLSQIIAHNQS